MLCKISYLAKFSEILAKLTKTELNLAKIMGELSFFMGRKKQKSEEEEKSLQHW